MTKKKPSIQRAKVIDSVTIWLEKEGPKVSFH